MLGEDGKYILSWKGSAHSRLFYYEAFREEAFMTQMVVLCFIMPRRMLQLDRGMSVLHPEVSLNVLSSTALTLYCFPSAPIDSCLRKTKENRTLFGYNSFFFFLRVPSILWTL